MYPFPIFCSFIFPSQLLHFSIIVFIYIYILYPFNFNIFCTFILPSPLSVAFFYHLILIIYIYIYPFYFFFVLLFFPLLFLSHFFIIAFFYHRILIIYISLLFFCTFILPTPLCVAFLTIPGPIIPSAAVSMRWADKGQDWLMSPLSPPDTSQQRSQLFPAAKLAVCRCVDALIYQLFC